LRDVGDVYHADPPARSERKLYRLWFRRTMTGGTRQPDDGIRIERATAVDAPLILDLIRELAEYERMSGDVVATEAGLRDALFGPVPAAEVLIAHSDGRPAGFALFFHNFSTFVGRRGLYLEDLFVRPEFRRRGIARRLLVELARIAV